MGKTGRLSDRLDRAAPDSKEQRIAELEGHRNTWRRVAFRLFDELEKHDPALAKSILGDERPLERVWLIRNKKSGVFMHWADTRRPSGCAPDQEIMSAVLDEKGTGEG